MSKLLLAGVTTALLVSAAGAQDIPALRGASPEEKARIEQLIDGARKEASLTYWDVVIQPQTNDALTAAFRKYYGLPDSFKVNYSLSATANLVTRVEQEIAANKVTIDIAAIGSPSWVFERAAAGDALEYDSPQYRHYQRVIDAGLGRKGFFAFNGAYLFVPMWDADQTSFKGKSWKDVIGAVPEGRLSVGDVSQSVSYLATYAGLRKVLDQNYFRQVAAMKPSFLIRSEQIAGRVVSGEDLLAVSGMPTRAYQLNQKGAKLKFMLPEEGVVLLALISGRAGFNSPLPDYAPPIESLKLIPVDWRGLSTDELKKIRAEWTGSVQPVGSGLLPPAASSRLTHRPAAVLR